MRTFSSATAVETPSVSNRRQPVRQTRTNPTRNATNVGQPRGSVVVRPVDTNNASPGFFPAITHFTDSISALPKEMVRNYTMLKEVDAKIYGPEELMSQLVTELLKLPVPPRKPADVQKTTETTTRSPWLPSDSLAQVDAESSPQVRPHEGPQAATPKEHDSSDVPRRRTMWSLRIVMHDMIPILDEKNHVMSTAIDELNKQLTRCDSSYSHIGNEVSEEARYGSLNHWAYTEKAAEKKGTLAGERTRRETAGNNHGANAGAGHDVEGVASRSEMRREALAARKRPNNHLDSDFDDNRFPAQVAGRKAPAYGKGRKAADPPAAINGTGIGLGIANGAPPAPPPSKRRKIEKPAAGMTAGGVPMDRAMSSVYGSNIGSTRGGAGSPRETPAVEAPKRRGRIAGAANGNTRRR